MLGMRGQGAKKNQGTKKLIYKLLAVFLGIVLIGIYVIPNDYIFATGDDQPQVQEEPAVPDESEPEEPDGGLPPDDPLAEPEEDPVEEPGELVAFEDDGGTLEAFAVITTFTDLQNLINTAPAGIETVATINTTIPMTAMLTINGGKKIKIDGSGTLTVNSNIRHFTISGTGND